MKERGEKRWARRLQVQFWEKGERPRVGYTVNVSPTGMFVATNSPCAKASRITVKVILPDRSLEMDANVHHSVRSSPLLQKIRQSGMGLRFLRRQPRIRELLAGEGTEGLEPVAEAAEDAPAAGRAAIPLGPPPAEAGESPEPVIEEDEPEDERADLTEEEGSTRQDAESFRRLERALAQARERAHGKEEELRQHLLRNDSRAEELSERVEELERSLAESETARRKISRHLMALTDGQEGRRAEIARLETARGVLEASLGEASSELERAGLELDAARHEIARLESEQRKPIIAAVPAPAEPIPFRDDPPAKRPRGRLLPFAGLLVAGIAVGIPLGMNLRAPAAESVAARRPADAGSLSETDPAKPQPDVARPEVPDRAAAEMESDPVSTGDAALEPPAGPTPSAAPAEPEPDSPPPQDAALAWAAAWSEQRVGDYLSFYSPRFEPPNDLSRDAWEAQRRERLLRPKSIKVRLDDIIRSDLGPGVARVRFRQSYETESYSDRVGKTLDLALESGRWRIIAERIDE